MIGEMRGRRFGPRPRPRGDALTRPWIEAKGRDPRWTCFLERRIALASVPWAFSGTPREKGGSPTFAVKQTAGELGPKAPVPAALR